MKIDYKYYFGATILAIGLAVLFTIVPANQNYFRNKDIRAIEDNKCEWGEVLANRSSTYRGYTVRAINESNDLGARVGVDRLGDIFKEENNDREMVSGESYSVLSCSNK